MPPAPLRSCVGCGTIRPKPELLRVHASPEGRLDVDVGGGSRRGAYVCPGRSCLDAALRRGEFARRLKVALAPTDLMALEVLIRARALGKVVSLLGLARRARKVVSGAEAVGSAVRRHKARLILTATDASAGSVDKVRALAAAAGAACYRLLSKEELGAAVGGAPRSCVVVTDPHFSEALASILAKCPPETVSAGPRPAEAMIPRGTAATREARR
ncbi:MAG: DUF448 domain-containing protein [Candidatus Methylomirabilaceae bacterium]